MKGACRCIAEEFFVAGPLRSELEVIVSALINGWCVEWDVRGITFRRQKKRKRREERNKE